MTTRGDAARKPGHALRRDVSAWGSYAWGYADVGADVYVALGLVLGAAMGAANIAFAAAGLVYVCIGLAYTELSAAYPVAGGGQFFVMRALGDFLGFVSGWALLLDFTIDIALFAWFSIGYASELIPTLSQHPWLFFGCAAGAVIALIVLNATGVHQSSRLNEVVALVDLLTETAVLVCGFVLAWEPQRLIGAFAHHAPPPSGLLFGTSLAIISFVGIESIAQAAEETKRPARVIPKTSIGLILSILIATLAFSTLALGMPDVSTAAGPVPMYYFLGMPHNSDKAVGVLASSIPIVGRAFALIVPVVGALLVLISSNSGVFGASRIALSMGRYNLLPGLLARTTKKARTPAVAIFVFGGAALIIMTAAFAQGDRALGFLADLYAFGATLSYTLVFAAVIALRYIDPAVPRPFLMPLNVRIGAGGGRRVSLLALLGFAGMAAIFVFTLLTHPVGRIVGPAWLIAGMGLYVWYRRKRGAPLFGSLRRDWDGILTETLRATGDKEVVEEFSARREIRGHRDPRDPRARRGRSGRR